MLYTLALWGASKGRIGSTLCPYHSGGSWAGVTLRLVKAGNSLCDLAGPVDFMLWEQPSLRRFIFTLRSGPAGHPRIMVYHRFTPSDISVCLSREKLFIRHMAL